MKKMKKASGGSIKVPAKPMTMAERVADRNRRMAEAMGDSPKPKPAPPKKKPDAYAMGGPVGAGMQAPMGRTAQAGPTAGPGIRQRGPEIPSPMPRPSDYRVGPLQFGQAGMMGNPLGNMLRGGGADGAGAMVPPRMQPSLPGAVGPGGGYKKGGRVDGCATRGKTKGAKK